MRLPLHDDWRYILLHSWSVGLHLITGTLVVAQLAIPFLFGVEAPLWLALASALAALVAGPLARIYHQRAFRADGTPRKAGDGGEHE